MTLHNSTSGRLIHSIVVPYLWKMNRNTPTPLLCARHVLMDDYRREIVTKALLDSLYWDLGVKVDMKF